MANNRRKGKAAKAASKARRDASFLASRGCVRPTPGPACAPAAAGANSTPAPAPGVVTGAPPPPRAPLVRVCAFSEAYIDETAGLEFFALDGAGSDAACCGLLGELGEDDSGFDLVAGLSEAEVDLQADELQMYTTSLPTDDPELEALAERIAAEMEQGAVAPPTATDAPAPTRPATDATTLPPTPKVAHERDAPPAPAAEEVPPPPPSKTPAVDAIRATRAEERQARSGAGAAPPPSAVADEPPRGSAVPWCELLLVRAGCVAVLGVTTAVLGVCAGVAACAATVEGYRRGPRAAWDSFVGSMAPVVWAAVDVGAAVAMVA